MLEAADSSVVILLPCVHGWMGFDPWCGQLFFFSHCIDFSWLAVRTFYVREFIGLFSLPYLISFSSDSSCCLLLTMVFQLHNLLIFEYLVALFPGFTSFVLPCFVAVSLSFCLEN